MSGVSGRDGPEAEGQIEEEAGLWHEAHNFEDPNLAGTRAEAGQAGRHEHPSKHEPASGNGQASANEHAPGGEHMHHSLQALFNAVHSRSRKREAEHKHLAEHGFDVPVRLSHLFKRPVVRQWLHEGYLFREMDERIPSRFELFFDLMFVGIAHVVAEGAAHHYSGLNVLKFIMEFFPAWSAWLDVRTFLNVHGTDDIKERLGLLGVMVVLTGYSANAAALEIFKCGSKSQVAANHGECLYSEELLSKRSEHSSSRPNIIYYIGSGYWFSEGYLSYFRSAIGFYLIWRAFRVVLYLYYGFALPKFRIAMWTNAVVKILTSVFYLPILKLFNPTLIIVLMFVSMCAEVLNGFLALGALKVQNEVRIRRGKEALYIPAISQEHAIERIVLFVIVVVGEMIISSTYVAKSSHSFASQEYGRSALSICCAFMLIWLYYDADSSRTYQHALRRNSLTSLLFTVVHFPLSACLILAGASLSKLIEKDVSEAGLLWYFSGSVGTFLLCVTIVAILHRNLDRHKSTLLPRWARLGARLVIGILITLLPLMRKNQVWVNHQYMAICASMLAALVIFETISKLGAVGRRFDGHNAALLRRAKLTTTSRKNKEEWPRIREARAQLRAMGAVRKPLFGGSEKSDTEKPSGQVRLRRTLSWHPYDGLTMGETGEEDVGMEGELGRLEMKEISAGQRWAFAA